METPRISIIAAVGKNRELGKKNGLIWRIPDDLKRFKALTMGHPIIMGRKTYESIGRPLPGRTNIVVTRGDFSAEGCVIAHSLEEALFTAEKLNCDEVFVIGGGQIYADALLLAHRLYLTIIDDTNPSADIFFPDYTSFSKVIETEKRNHDGLAYKWVTLERA